MFGLPLADWIASHLLEIHGIGFAAFPTWVPFVCGLLVLGIFRLALGVPWVASLLIAGPMTVIMTLVETSHGDAPLEVLLGSGRFDPSRMPPEDAHTHQKAGPHVERWSYRTRARFSPDALQHMVKRELPASVYRCKGIIFTTDSDEPHALQVVGRRCDITPVELDRPLATGTSELVAIGRNIDGSELNRLFGECESSGRS